MDALVLNAARVVELELGVKQELVRELIVGHPTTAGRQARAAIAADVAIVAIAVAVAAAGLKRSRP